MDRGQERVQDVRGNTCMPHEGTKLAAEEGIEGLFQYDTMLGDLQITGLENGKQIWATTGIGWHALPGLGLTLLYKIIQTTFQRVV